MLDNRSLATVEQVIPLSNSILQVILKPKNYFKYKAGQYLQIISNKQRWLYSIANAPLGSHLYELHIRHNRENQQHQKLLHKLMEKGVVKIGGPFGNCHVDKLKKQQPILFIAQGTGFAPIKAMIETLLAQDDKRVFELIWGAYSLSDLYMDEKVRQWQAHVTHFRYSSLLSHSTPVNFITTVTRTILNQHPSNLTRWQVVIGGSFDMVYGIRDHLLRIGLKQTQLYSDAFDFE